MARKELACQPAEQEAQNHRIRLEKEIKDAQPRLVKLARALPVGRLTLIPRFLRDPLPIFELGVIEEHYIPPQFPTPTPVHYELRLAIDVDGTLLLWKAFGAKPLKVSELPLRWLERVRGIVGEVLR